MKISLGKFWEDHNKNEERGELEMRSVHVKHCLEAA